MMRIKHVLVLITLILPMFVLAPSLVPGPNELITTNNVMVDTALPAQFVEERLRVAVYVEDNTSLPVYASGGTYTNNYANVIQLLENEGYDVIPMSTQDILDHKLMAANFDAFVLVDQLPKDDIVDLVKDYWLAGGGILSFHSSIGFLYYYGMIVPADTGNFGLLHIDSGAHWGYDVVSNFTVGARHSTAKDYQISDTIIITDNTTIHDSYHFDDSNPGDFVPLLLSEPEPGDSVGFALDNTVRQGGRIVQLPGNCSVIPAWEKSVIIDSIDWLAPRPKGRILFDLSHLPELTPDPWDPWVLPFTLATWRNGLVNHYYIVDKLHPSSEGNLTTDNLEGYDMLVVFMPNLNFTAQEVNDVGDWVANGGGLLLVGDHPGTFPDMMPNLNYLLSWSDIKYNTTVPGPFDTVCSPTDDHPINEGIGSIVVHGFSYPYVTGDAYSIWEHSGVGIAVAGEEYGNGRVIACPDGNFFTDTLGIFDLDNYQFHLNVANWLSAATADVLLYVDNLGLADPWDAPAIDALNDLGIPFYLTAADSYMNLSLYSQQWSLVILDSAWPGIQPYFDDFSSYLDAGGDLIVSWHQVDTFDTEPFYAKIGFEFSGDLPDKVPFYIWDTGHGIFNYPNNYGAANFTSVDDYGDEGDLLTVYSNATALAGYTDTNLPGNATTVLGFGGQVLWNSYLIDQLTGDYDDSTYTDTFELWENEIAFMYYDRPTINSPADVTYMETETGNEITWTPTADAGPWEYVFSVNGTPVEGGHWDGSVLAFNVDGVNVSITEYELMVFDVLGYSVSDLVVLNVTEYVEPPGPGGIDPALLLIIGAAVAGVVIILVVVMQLKKKK